MSALLLRLYHEQWGECFYCERETWLQTHGQNHHSAALTLGIDYKADGWQKTLMGRRASIEHLMRKTDGGKNGKYNLVMADAGCNSSRNATTVEDHKRAMMRRYWGIDTLTDQQLRHRSRRTLWLWGEPGTEPERWIAPVRLPEGFGTAAERVLFPLFEIERPTQESL